ncbi:polysaccharide deacetylase family protein [Psychroflexus montanilacus]|uniref:polysaccharide deacetylase family protein n=1 Tax=Psychroflexus montanilacus TaxID=2873598 RepID=UPI001CCB1C8F|nr:polysaccharide deacetylase family protein [Psychroflexus montanilacus]MBZ9651397.1 polysaccharide deacetylase family protein [Psychroflexus montanilacus]
MKSNDFLKQIFPKRVWNISSFKKEMFLTFDDGPIPEVTPWVLDQLKKHKAKATFFCIGDNIRKHPELFQQIVAEGHAVGNHTFHHINGWKTSTEEYLKDVKRCEDEIGSNTFESNLFRPPYGKCTSAQAKSILEKGDHIIMWDIISKDYDAKVSKENCFLRIKKNAKPGSIIVFHDSLKAETNMKYALEKTLETFSDYEFNKIEL